MVAFDMFSNTHNLLIQGMTENQFNFNNTLLKTLKEYMKMGEGVMAV